MTTMEQVSTRGRGMTSEEKFVIFASSLGTTFEWYDFYLYAVLAPFFASLFFPPGNDTAALLSAFATYAAGFLVRPFGALVFSRIGDLVGTKIYLPRYHHGDGNIDLPSGLATDLREHRLACAGAPRDAALAAGPCSWWEYGGAATYVAEHARAGERGYRRSWIQTTATVGLALALVIIILCREFMDAKAFSEWGWRIPFLVSAILLVFSIYIRLWLNEIPIFRR
jgi:MFS family permease